MCQALAPGLREPQPALHAGHTGSLSRPPSSCPTSSPRSTEPHPTAEHLTAPLQGLHQTCTCPLYVPWQDAQPCYADPTVGSTSSPSPWAPLPASSHHFNHSLTGQTLGLGALFYLLANAKDVDLKSLEAWIRNTQLRGCSGLSTTSWVSLEAAMAGREGRGQRQSRRQSLLPERSSQGQPAFAGRPGTA